MYISFNELSIKLQNDPFVSDKWNSLSDKEKQGFYDFIIAEVESHNWKGRKADQYQRFVFPRIMGSTFVTWQDDPHREFESPIQTGNYHVLPNFLIVKSVSNLLLKKANMAIENKSKYIEEETIDILTTKFHDRKDIKSDLENGIYLPEPLWSELKYYSNHYSTQNRFFKIERA